jgi:hypothetical protein
MGCGMLSDCLIVPRTASRDKEDQGMGAALGEPGDLILLVISILTPHKLPNKWLH